MGVVIMMRNNLKKIRKHEGISISGLSRLSGVSEKTIRILEKQSTNSRDETKQKLCNGINKNPNRTREYIVGEIFPN